ncbi:GumC family protein [Hymenobacter terrestris]|uniref:non-specific protein-tyrosine kinase n=1 Tax=Hymenobacter terrestris TaxID=2748310 RepID=A0ABX2Q562_9BACT|nr:polysaccharide biosynthesis tyrosine autokinase [Hymenobacter terrestris]NVO86105.1 AAA family ATPase [Hymenobacter terrestris]
MSLLLALGAAWCYLRYVKPVYQIKSTLAIQDEATVPKKSTLQELELVTSPKVIETEIEILKSRRFIRQGVDELGLSTSYELKTGLLTRDLYQDSPVKLVLLQPFDTVEDQVLYLYLNSPTSFTLEEAGKPARTLSMDETVQSGFGAWHLEPTTHVRHFIGATIKIELQNPEKVTARYQKGIEAVMLSKKAPTLSLTVNESNPDRGKALLNYLTKALNDASIAEQNRISQSTISFINERLQSITKELNAYEKEEANYRSQRGITDISSQSRIYLENDQANGNSLNEVNVQLNVIAGLEQYLTEGQADEKAPSTVGINDPGLNSLIEKLSQLQLQREKLLATTPADNPLFEPLNRQLTSTRTAIRNNVQGIKASLVNTRKQLQSYKSSISSNIQSMPGQERQLGSIKRQQAIKENLYTYLLQKREELSLKYASATADVRVVDTAFVGDVVWPKKPLVLAIALLLGLGLPLFIVLIREYLHKRVVSREEIEHTLAVSVLAEVNHAGKLRSGLISDQPSGVVAEQFRVLRTVLRTLPVSQHPGRVILITSSVANEGKTFVSANLAVSLAASGRKTVYCAFDLRRPGATGFTLAGGVAQPGLSELLTGGATLAQTIQYPEGQSNLHFIGSGAPAANLAQLIESSAAAELIKQLRELYDDVIIDSPPVHLVSDARILAPCADVTLYVIRQGVTPVEELDFVQRLASGKEFQELQFVFNGINKAKHGYGYEFDESYFQQRPHLVS